MLNEIDRLHNIQKALTAYSQVTVSPDLSTYLTAHQPLHSKMCTCNVPASCVPIVVVHVAADQFVGHITVYLQSFLTRCTSCVGASEEGEQSKDGEASSEHRGASSWCCKSHSIRLFYRLKLLGPSRFARHSLRFGFRCERNNHGDDLPQSLCTY